MGSHHEYMYQIYVKRKARERSGLTLVSWSLTGSSVSAGTVEHSAHALAVSRRGPHGRVRPDVMCVEKGSEMILWVWSIGVLSYIPRVAYHLPNAY